MTQLPQVGEGYSAEQLDSAIEIAQKMDAVIGRLTYDKDFAASLANNPRETLAAANLLMDKEAVEILIAVDPDRFDRACESLFDLVDSDFLHKIVMPSCANPIQPYVVTASA